MKSVLIVENNTIAREGLAAVLRQRGYQVAMAMDGQGGLEYLRSGERPDVILLDMLMPGVDGWQFLEKVDRFVPRGLVPIIITTGSILTREWALDHGAVGFLKKPFDENELLAEVQRCAS